MRSISTAKSLYSHLSGPPPERRVEIGRRRNGDKFYDVPCMAVARGGIEQRGSATGTTAVSALRSRVLDRTARLIVSTVSCPRPGRGLLRRLGARPPSLDRPSTDPPLRARSRWSTLDRTPTYEIRCLFDTGHALRERREIASAPKSPPHPADRHDTIEPHRRAQPHNSEPGANILFVQSDQTATLQ